MRRSPPAGCAACRAPACSPFPRAGRPPAAEGRRQPLEQRSAIEVTDQGQREAIGADLLEATGGSSPTFLVAALKDPIGANLDRIQIVKGWMDAKGKTHEKVYDVVW